MLPLAAALVVATVLIGSAGMAIGLSPDRTGYDVAAADSTADPAMAGAGGAPTGPTRNDGLAPLTAVTTAPPAPEVVSSGTCDAVYYSRGQRTASGEDFDPDGLTTAHRSLPFGTLVRVTNLATGASVVVRVNDRAQMSSGRCLDLSVGAFRAIAKTSQGVAAVRYEVLAPSAA